MTISNYGFDYWQYEIRRIIKYYRQKYPKQAKNYRIRLTVFRNDGGFYTPLTNQASYILELELLKNELFTWNKKGQEIGVFEEIELNKGKLQNLKTANSLPYVLAGLYKKKQGLDDVLLVNTEGRIVESIHSNVFFIKGNSLITPALKEGCTAGTIRKSILKIGKDLGMKVVKGKCDISLLNEADEVFLTNAIQGVQWVRKFEKRNMIVPKQARFIAK
ncbi:MAG: aminotransferase class IV [Saprospiraceae bacterium]|nr:aminotransferase class IV [Saprospiraceae bacterium]